MNMVFQKRFDYGSSGSRVPVMPRVPRSARGKRSVRKKVEEKQMCAFDLLATVAGELLSEREGSPSASKVIGMSNPAAVDNGDKQKDGRSEKPFKAEVFDQGSCNESTPGSDGVFKRQASYSLNEDPQASLITMEKELIGSIKNGEFGHSLPTIGNKCRTEGLALGPKELCDLKLEIGIKTPLQVDRRMTGNAVGNGPERFEDPMDLDAKPPPLISSDSSVEVPVSHNGSFPKSRDSMKLPLHKDDDENSSGCTHPSIKTSKAFRPQHIGDRRARKLLATKFWKTATTAPKIRELSNTDEEMKHIPRSRKMCYTRQRTQRSSFKRRKLFERCSITASEGGIRNEGVPYSPKFGGIKVEARDSHAGFNRANGASSSSSGQKSSYGSEDFHVKLSIKSFKVPELFIEIPETATVGSLKRTVMEAVTAILSGGLKVGVLHQGKKVRDDNKTLLQAGISHNTQMDNLGFTLDPNPTQTPPLTCAEDPTFLLPLETTEPLQRIPATAPPPLDQLPSEATPQPPQQSILNFPESDHDSVHSPSDASSVDKTTICKAVVAVPSMSVEALAMVPLRKSRRSELVQRRIRRPFSVTEVEALVQAVEKLGTGRWRDVKLRAFDNAKHRTYVDLKDKWKTLVHTARISPQQRRGEPVPQDLLDRVLNAHAYWTQQAAKLQVKPPSAMTETGLLL